MAMVYYWKLKEPQIPKYFCESRHESFHPFVVSRDGMLAPEATKIFQHLADLMANKQQQPYSAIMKHL
jgi:hypothetical protein